MIIHLHTNNQRKITLKSIFGIAASYYHYILLSLISIIHEFSLDTKGMHNDFSCIIFLQEWI